MEDNNEDENEMKVLNPWNGKTQTYAQYLKDVAARFGSQDESGEATLAIES